MEVKLDSLIERIKQEGVDQAKKDSDEILKQAKNTALEIVAKAKAESEALLEKTKKSAEQLEKNAKAAVNQAARDTVLVVREKLNLICDRAFKKKIEQSLSVDFLQAVITKIIDGWAQGKEVEILLNKRDVSALGEGLLSELRQELKKTVVIKVDERVQSGFKIGVKGEDVFYDFTSAGIFEALQQFLSPALAEILDVDNG